MRKLLICTLLLIISTGACLAAGGVMNTPVKNSDEALKRARDFFKNVSWSDPAEPVVEGPLSDGSYRVAIGDLIADIDSATGQVHYAKRKTYSPPSGKGGAISEEGAERKSLAYLRSAGVPLDESKIDASAVPKPSAATYGVIDYLRIAQGIQYINDYIRVNVYPSNGVLLSLRYEFNSPKLEKFSIKLKKQDAITKAGAYIAGNFAPAGKAVYAELRLVQPNNYYDYVDVGGAADKPVISRPAWVIQFSNPWVVTEIWMDAETGTVLGGSTTGYPKVKLNPLILAEKVTLGDSSSLSDNDIKRLGLAIFPLTSVQPSECKPALKLTLQVKDKSYTCVYSSEAHRLILLEKRWNGKSIKGNIAWETTKEFEQLMAELSSKR